MKNSLRVELLSSNAAIYYIKHLDSHCILTTVLGRIALVKKGPDNLANRPRQVHFFFLSNPRSILRIRNILLVVFVKKMHLKLFLYLSDVSFD